MRRIATSADTQRIDLGDGDWVDLKRRLTVADRRVINNAVMGTSEPRRTVATDADGNTVESVAGVDWAATAPAMILTSVVAWGGPGFCVHDHDADQSAHDETGASNGCRPIPVTPENVDALDDATGERIVTELMRTDPIPSKEVTAHP